MAAASPSAAAATSGAASTSTSTSAAAPAAAPSAEADDGPDPANAGQAPIAPADRPAASGHRFGPDLACSECGTQWEAHQRQPTPCATETPDDAFLRRPDVADLTD